MVTKAVVIYGLGFSVFRYMALAMCHIGIKGMFKVSHLWTKCYTVDQRVWSLSECIGTAQTTMYIVLPWIDRYAVYTADKGGTMTNGRSHPLAALQAMVKGAKKTDTCMSNFGKVFNVLISFRKIFPEHCLEESSIIFWTMLISVHYVILCYCSSVFLCDTERYLGVFAWCLHKSIWKHVLSLYIHWL